MSFTYTKLSAASTVSSEIHASTMLLLRVLGIETVIMGVPIKFFKEVI